MSGKGFAKIIFGIVITGTWGFVLISALAGADVSTIQVLSGVFFVIYGLHLIYKGIIEESQLQNAIANSQNRLSGADEIVKYKELLDRGIITQDEFEAKKIKLLEEDTSVLQQEPYTNVVQEKIDEMIQELSRKLNENKKSVFAVVLAIGLLIIIAYSLPVGVIFDATIYAGIDVETLYELHPDLEYEGEVSISFGILVADSYVVDNNSQGKIKFEVYDDRVFRLYYRSLDSLNHKSFRRVVEMFGITPSDQMRDVDNYLHGATFHWVSDNVSEFLVKAQGRENDKIHTVEIIFDSVCGGAFASETKDK